jgi:glutamate carboxypeptidase
LFEAEDARHMQNADHRRILAHLRDHLPEMTVLLAQLVEMESSSHHKPLLDRLGAFLADQVRGLGAVADILPQTETGDHLRARWGNVAGGALLLCHMDTVWEPGTLAHQPIRIADGLFYGPGAFDMKGGIVIALWAMRSLLELNLLPDRRVTLLLTSDEEIGSRTSRTIIESEALSHDVVFVLEPAQPPHASLKTSRKGVGLYHVTVTGRQAHAGSDHDSVRHRRDGAPNPDHPAFTEYRGTTVNAGVVRGGTRRCRPAQATARDVLPVRC